MDLPGTPVTFPVCLPQNASISYDLYLYSQEGTLLKQIAIFRNGFQQSSFPPPAASPYRASFFPGGFKILPALPAITRKKRSR